MTRVVGEQSAPAGAPVRGESAFSFGDVLEVGQRGRAGRDVAVEGGGPAGVRAQRHDESHALPVRGAQAAQVPERGVGDDDQPGWGQRLQPLQGLAQAGQLGLGSGVWPQVERDPGRGGGLQGAHLAGHSAV